jgi:peroxiredoxin Q/BCP
MAHQSGRPVLAIVNALASSPKPGDEAPDFELEGTAGSFRLSAERGHAVVLLFYPRDQSAVCTAQFCSYRDHDAELAALGATVVGVSAQDVASHQRFIERHRLTIPLLADVDFAVARAYGVRSRLLGTRRATFVIDARGVVRYRREHLLSVGFDSVSDLRRAVSGAC